MARFLINASNLKQGGGIQVTQSIVAQIERFKEHFFVIVLSSYIKINEVFGDNFEVVVYDIKNHISNLIFGRDAFLDNLVKEHRVDAVLTVFGPSRWRPRVPHLCGFARAQLVLTDSPYYQRLNLKDRFIYKIWKWSFKKILYRKRIYLRKVAQTAGRWDKSLYCLQLLQSDI